MKYLCLAVLLALAAPAQAGVKRCLNDKGAVVAYVDTNCPAGTSVEDVKGLVANTTKAEPPAPPHVPDPSQHSTASADEIMGKCLSEMAKGFSSMYPDATDPRLPTSLENASAAGEEGKGSYKFTGEISYADQNGAELAASVECAATETAPNNWELKFMFKARKVASETATTEEEAATTAKTSQKGKRTREPVTRGPVDRSNYGSSTTQEEPATGADTSSSN